MYRLRSFPTAIRGILLVASVAAQAVAAEPPAEARAHLKAGLEHLEGRRYDEAYRELEAAYAIAPKPKLLANIGIAAEHLERDGKAIDAYRGCLDAGGLSEREAKPLRQSIERLQASIATVTLEAPGEFWIVDTRSDDGAHVVNEYGPFDGRVELRVRAGTHTFELQRAAIQAPAWTVPLHSGNSAAHTFEAEPVPSVIETFQAETGDLERAAVEADVQQPTHTMSYVLWGTGAAGAVAATVFLLEANGMQSQANEDYWQRCPLGGVTAECTGATRGDEKAANWRTAALVTGAGALGAIVGGTILYLLDGPSSSSGEATEAAVQPWLGPNGVGVSGVF